MERLLQKIDLIDLEKQRIQLEFDNYKQSTQEIGELMEKCAENASLKADLDIAKKVLGRIFYSGGIELRF